MRFVKTLPPKASTRGNNQQGAANRQQYEKDAARLRERPGDWALFRTVDNVNAATSMASQITRGANMAFRPKGSFEAATRTVDGQPRVYVRYVGE